VKAAGRSPSRRGALLSVLMEQRRWQTERKDQAQDERQDATAGNAETLDASPTKRYET